jgi:hypothetical protein
MPSIGGRIGPCIRIVQAEERAAAVASSTPLFRYPPVIC